MAWTLEDQQVKDLQKDTGWDPQRSLDWASRYYTKPDQAAAPAPTGPTGGGSPAPATPTDPYKAPAQSYTATAGGQDVLRKALTDQMGQSQIPSASDPAIQAQSVPYAAAQERARREEVRRGAEESFAGGQDYGTPEKMAAAERAGQNTGLFESQLVGREMSARRSQISDALGKYAGLLSQDQEAALRKELAQLDAQLRREGLAQAGSLGSQDLALRRDLGTGGLSLDAARLAMQDKQFGQDLGFRIGSTQAGFDRDALLSMLGA